MANSLKISRTSVWRVIKRLKQYNVLINTSPKGYQLEHALKLLDKKQIQGIIQNPEIHLEIVESIISTNDYLQTKPSDKKLHLCLAEHQIKGRGRLGRAWVSPFGRNIYCSLRYVFKKDVSAISGLSLVVGILVVSALEALDTALKPALKWPNDIQVNSQKIGGILIEMAGAADEYCQVIIGLGINVNMKNQKLDNVDQPWTSLEHILNRRLDRSIICGEVIKSLLKGLEIFNEKGLAPFLAEWKKYDLLEGKRVIVRSSGKEFSGLAQGINQSGHLMVELSSGETKIFSSVDVLLLREQPSI